MLKAYLIKKDGMQSIYYPNSGRTISLENCLSRIYTNVRDPLRANMHKAIDLRNTSTHFVVQEYESFYGPILQACVENYDELDSRRFSCTYVTELRTTKKANADLSFRVSREGDTPVAMVKTLVQAKDKYPYRPGMVVEAINDRIRKAKLVLLQDGIDTRTRNKGAKPFSMYHFGLFKSVYSMQGDDRYSYNSALAGENPAYIYSQQAVDLIWDRIREDPARVLDRMREMTKNGSA